MSVLHAMSDKPTFGVVINYQSKFDALGLYLPSWSESRLLAFYFLDTLEVIPDIGSIITVQLQPGEAGNPAELEFVAGSLNVLSNYVRVAPEWLSIAENIWSA